MIEINLIQYMQTKMLNWQALVFFIFFLFACTNGKTDKNNSTSLQTEEPVIASSQMSPSKSIAENIMVDSSYSILVEALKSTDIIETLTKPGPFTLFAPANNAFEKLPPGTLDGWLSDRKNDLANILSFHIVSRLLLEKNLEDG